MTPTPMLTQLKTCLNRGVPLVGIVAPDQGDTMRKVLASVGDRPKLLWDGARGLVGVTPPGCAAAEALGFGPHADDSGPPPPDGTDPTVVFPALRALAPKAVVVVLNAHLIIRSDYPGFQKTTQAIWNLRDEFKSNGRMLVLLGPMLEFPPELNQDIVVLEDPRPTREEVAALIAEQHGHAAQAAGDSFPALTDEVKEQAATAATGFPLFLTEQIVAMSMDPKAPGGISVPNLWLRKKQEVRKLKGVNIHEEGSFATIGGNDEAKRALAEIFGGRRRPDAVVMFDELEKGVGGYGTETSGTKIGMVGSLLKSMTDWQWNGLIFTGVAGSGKTALAKACAEEFGVPVLGCNLEEFEDRYVGGTTINLMAALQTAQAIGNGRVLAIAVTNSVKALPGELVRRFGLGCLFFDLPSPTEQQAIVAVYNEKYEVTPDEMPDLQGWTGNDISRAWSKAYFDVIPLSAAIRSIVPYGVSHRRLIEAQRAEADSTYSSASYPGVYRKETTAGGRAFSFGNETA